jgi:hypothetical protein
MGVISLNISSVDVQMFKHRRQHILAYFLLKYKISGKKKGAKSSGCVVAHGVLVYAEFNRIFFTAQSDRVDTFTQLSRCIQVRGGQLFPRSKQCGHSLQYVPLRELTYIP